MGGRETSVAVGGTQQVDHSSYRMLQPVRILAVLALLSPLRSIAGDDGVSDEQRTAIDRVLELLKWVDSDSQAIEWPYDFGDPGAKKSYLVSPLEEASAVARPATVLRGAAFGGRAESTIPPSHPSDSLRRPCPPPVRRRGARDLQSAGDRGPLACRCRSSSRASRSPTVCKADRPAYPSVRPITPHAIRGPAAPIGGSSGSLPRAWTMIERPRTE